MPSPVQLLWTAVQRRVLNLQVLKEQEVSVLHMLCGVNSDRYCLIMERCIRFCERC